LTLNLSLLSLISFFFPTRGSLPKALNFRCSLHPPPSSPRILNVPILRPPGLPPTGVPVSFSPLCLPFPVSFFFSRALIFVSDSIEPFVYLSSPDGISWFKLLSSFRLREYFKLARQIFIVFEEGSVSSVVSCFSLHAELVPPPLWRYFLYSYYYFSFHNNSGTFLQISVSPVFSPPL